MTKGKLTIFTSYTPGAGKSYLMIQEFIKQKQAGKKAKIGFLNSTHREMNELLKSGGLELGNAKKYSLKNILEEKPELVIMDEMGMHGINADSDDESFVYKDIEMLLNSGIDVYATVNLKRIESANPEFKKVTGIGIKKTVPDRFLDMANKIFFVDRSPRQMRLDFNKGKLFSKKYMQSKIMNKNFKIEVLSGYRDIALEYIEKYSDKTTIIVRQ